MDEKSDLTLKQCTDSCAGDDSCQSFSFRPGSGGKGICQRYHGVFSDNGHINIGPIKFDRQDTINRAKPPLFNMKIEGGNNPNYHIVPKEGDTGINYASQSNSYLGTCLETCKKDPKCVQMQYIPVHKTTPEDVVLTRCRILHEKYPIVKSAFPAYVYEELTDTQNCETDDDCWSSRNKFCGDNGMCVETKPEATVCTLDTDCSHNATKKFCDNGMCVEGSAQQQSILYYG